MDLIRSPLDRAAIRAGLIGSSVIALGSIVTALAYTGSMGQPYDPLDHFVSELGELGVSQMAPVFNVALIIGGLCFVVFMLGLAITRRGGLRYAYGVTGFVAGLGGTLVGIFPMNELGRHRLAALTFFLFGLVTVLLASIDFVRARDPRFPRWLSAIGAATAICFATFLVILFGGSEGLGQPDERPAIWPLTIFEWLLIVGIVGWTFLTAFTWQRATR